MSLRRIRHETDGGVVSGVEFGDPVRPYDALFLHATGFNAMTYQSMLAPLGFRARVAAIDLRGHGRTTLPARPPFASWAVYRDDVIAWLDRHAPEGVVLAGHSMGGCVSLMVAGKRPDLVKAMVLVDPVVLSRAFYRARHLFPLMHRWMASGNHMAKAARRRRNAFKSPDEARLVYMSRAAFSTWREPFLIDYLLDGLERVDQNPRESEDQTWRLLCDPEWEAATFLAQRNRPWAALSALRKSKTPMTVLVPGRGAVLTDKVVDELRQRVGHATIKPIGGSTHFLPMEAPYLVRDEMAAYLSHLVDGFAPEHEAPVRRRLTT